MFIHILQDLNKDIFNFENFRSIILFARYTLFFYKAIFISLYITSHCDLLSLTRTTSLIKTRETRNRLMKSLLQIISKRCNQRRPDTPDT